MIAHALILHLTTSLPIDNLRLCEYEAHRMVGVDQDSDPGTRALQQWFHDFLPGRDACGKFILTPER
jgi:hypothetical protein